MRFSVLRRSPWFAPPIRRQIQEAYDAAGSHPLDATASGRLGMFLHAYQQNQSAAVCFELAHTLDPQEFRWTHYLATIQAAGAILEAAGELEQSTAAHEQALEIDLKLEQAYIILISLYRRLRQPGKAEAQYKFLLAINPNLAEDHYNFGVLLTGQGRNSEASEALRMAL